MRPTDENQAASMRPNLMSPKRERTSGEDSILAMLERDPTRRRGAAGGRSGLRLACYGIGAVVAIGLTGTLVWLAAGNDGLHPAVERGMIAASSQATPHPGNVAQTPAPALVQVALATGAAPAARPGNTAVIVDQQPDGVPPLRLLKPAPATPERTPAVPTKPQAKARPAAVARNAARPAPPRAQRPAAAARADAAVDPDVALISAVIVHANGHAPENSQMTELLCPNDACQNRQLPPPRQ